MTCTIPRINPPARQRGVVLFVGLIMLLLLTLIGIAAMQVTVLQERMAGNFYVQHLGFEDAEAVLASGRETLRSNTNSYSDTYVTLDGSNEPPWAGWLTSEPSTPQTQIMRLYKFSVGGSTGNYYSVTVVGADASDDAKTALQGIYIFQ